MALSNLSQAELQQFYIGKDIGDVPKPAVILDVAIIRRHCETMLRTIKELNVGFRAHVKTHKVKCFSFSPWSSHSANLSSS
jgi:D-serine deaminase-like pyridoxal phosphate-dependent protein